MNTFWLRDFGGAARVRRRVRALAEALGAEDGAAVEQVAGELACNSVEHRTGPAAAQLRCYRCGNRLVIETLNRCSRAPDWHSEKDPGGSPYRLGGRGLALVAGLADRFGCGWEQRQGIGYVRARAEFPLRREDAPPPAIGGSAGDRAPLHQPAPPGRSANSA
jgi:hypothetical protein